MSVRKDVRNLTSTEKQNYIKAVKALKADISPRTGRSIYDEFILWHSNATVTMDSSDPNPIRAPEALRNAAHQGPVFLPWHRYFLSQFERQLQRKVPGVFIPYWDWTKDSANPGASPIWADDFLGGNGDPNDNYVVKTGPFAMGQWTIVDNAGNPASLRREFGLPPRPQTLPNQAEVDTALGETPYDNSPWNATSSPSHRNRLEGAEGFPEIQLHNRVHAWIGGTMSTVQVSPGDPVFFLHHANVDRIWALWQERNRRELYQPIQGGPSGHNVADFMYPWDGQATRLRARPAQVLNYRALGYSYA
jgi:tyrosinase